MKCPGLLQSSRPKEWRFVSTFITHQIGPCALVALLCLASAGCSLFKKDKPKDETPRALHIGTVQMVNPEQAYVLIRCEQLYNLPPGTEVLAVAPDGQSSRLKLTPERKSWFWTADIQEGQPAIGHVVFYRKNGAALPDMPTQPAAATKPAPVSGYPQPPSLGLPSLPGLPAGFEVPQNMETLPADAP